jgi:predicted metallopeptidase
VGGAQLPLFAPVPAPGFDLAGELDRLVADIARVCRGFGHIDPARLLVGWTSSRRRRFGTYATIYPLRFARGRTSVAARGTLWHLPRIVRDGHEILYVIMFYVPRFFALDARARLSVVFHELFHVSEAFDGDLRRFDGYRSAHGRSTAWFESRYQDELAVYVASRRARFFHDLLCLSHREIEARHGALIPRRVRRPILERRRSTWRVTSAAGPEGRLALVRTRATEIA